MIDLYGVDAALERLLKFLPDTPEANQAYAKVEAELIMRGHQALELVQDWTTRLRMGYDLGMSKLEMLDELERVLK